MHWQSTNPFRERDHAISLMPLRPEGEPSLAKGLALVAAFAAILATAWSMTP